ncbi:hypothetical protein BKA70DRAFT_1280297 [Coprinopsis sp. MPI-PUGE-AT-0042]|nr:hypothetical protein BKA70DRAFT_1280297 [Coprinopsis sp. MPI-PUGE-AT-0042]
MSVNLTGPAESPKRSDLFFPARGIFRVENTLYDIPKHALTDHSEVFAGMFLLSDAEGITEDNPIILDGYKSTEFEALLKLLLPRRTSVTFDYKPKLTKDEWIGVLKLATVWKMNAVQELAITELSKIYLELGEKLQLARQYHVAKWFLEAVTSMASIIRDGGADTVPAIATMLGWEATAKMLSALRLKEPFSGLDITRLECPYCKERFTKLVDGIPACERKLRKCSFGWFFVRKTGLSPPQFIAGGRLKMVCADCKVDYPEDDKHCSSCTEEMSRSFVWVNECPAIKESVATVFGEELRDLEAY